MTAAVEPLTVGSGTTTVAEPATAEEIGTTSAVELLITGAGIAALLTGPDVGTTIDPELLIAEGMGVPVELTLWDTRLVINGNTDTKTVLFMVPAPGTGTGTGTGAMVPLGLGGPAPGIGMSVALLHL